MLKLKSDNSVISSSAAIFIPVFTFFWSPIVSVGLFVLVSILIIDSEFIKMFFSHFRNVLNLVLLIIVIVPILFVQLAFFMLKPNPTTLNLIDLSEPSNIILTLLSYSLEVGIFLFVLILIGTQVPKYKIYLLFSFTFIAVFFRSSFANDWILRLFAPVTFYIFVLLFIEIQRIFDSKSSKSRSSYFVLTIFLLGSITGVIELKNRVTPFRAQTFAVNQIFFPELSRNPCLNGSNCSLTGNLFANNDVANQYWAGNSYAKCPNLTAYADAVATYDLINEKIEEVKYGKCIKTKGYTKYSVNPLIECAITNQDSVLFYVPQKRGGICGTTNPQTFDKVLVSQLNVFPVSIFR